MAKLLTLALETSCDETSAAVVGDGTEVLSNIIASQIARHREFGGVVPEIAARQHLAAVIPVVEAALHDAGVTLNDIGLIAVTTGPGLVGALLIGVTVAKAIAYARALPLVTVNHVEGHIFANLLGNRQIETPLVCLTVSGGHTDLLHMPEFGRYEVLGRTRDDAAGEALDKVARVLGLGYPGGPEIEKLAQSGDSSSFSMPAVRPSDGSLDFSFSGLKTAAINAVHRLRQADREIPVADLAASFQEAVISQLVDRVEKALEKTGVQTLLLSGGVASNQRLREAVVRLGEKRGVQVHIPKRIYCTDNAAMIASAGHFRFQHNGCVGAPLDVNAYPEMPLY